MKYSGTKLLTIMLLGFLLSGCSIIGAAYDVVTLPIVIVGEAAGGIADAVSDDDEEEKERHEGSDDTHDKHKE